MSEYWAYTWLDNRRIRTLDELKANLSSEAAIDDLKQAAELVIQSWRCSTIEARPRSLIAGAGIDLSGRLDCNHTDCRRAQIDRLFRRAWHYFQTIVARDAIAEDLRFYNARSDAELAERLVPHFETALMIREVGAEALVEFLPRVPACFQHWRQHAQEAGISDIADREAEIVDQLRHGSTVDIGQQPDGVMCAVNNPDFPHTHYLAFSKEKIKGKTDQQIESDAIRWTARTFLVHLRADVNAARKYGGAYGSTIPIFRKLLANRDKKVSNVAFEVELPVLNGLSTAQLIEVRLKYQDTFLRFQKRLTAFLQKCLQSGITDQADIRARFEDDLIDGELEELKHILKQAKEAFTRKSLYALSFGSLVATVGAMTGIVPPATAFSLLATVSAASLSPGVSKYLDDVTRIKSADMYFLLQAESDYR